MTFKNPIKEIISEIKNWFNSYVELIQVKGIKKAVEVSTKITFYFLLILFLMTALFFMGIALSFFIGKLVNSVALGFLIVGGIPVLFLVFMLLFKQKAQQLLLDFFTRLFTK